MSGGQQPALVIELREHRDRANALSGRPLGLLTILPASRRVGSTEVAAGFSYVLRDGEVFVQGKVAGYDPRLGPWGLVHAALAEALA